MTKDELEEYEDALWKVAKQARKIGNGPLANMATTERNWVVIEIEAMK